MPPAPDGPAPLADALAALDHPGARRRFGVIPAGAHPGVGWITLEQFHRPADRAARTLADPVAGLGIDELTGSMAFHAAAVPLVDLAVSLLVTAGAAVDLEPERIWVREEGHAVVQVLVDGALAAHRADVERVADQLVAGLDALVEAIEPHDPELRWGAVADLVAVLGLGRQRTAPAGAGPSAEDAWARIDDLVGAVARRRPVPGGGPARLDVATERGPLTMARRCSCCQWHRAARSLGEPSVTDARCADCPALDRSVNEARLAALADRGELAAP